MSRFVLPGIWALGAWLALMPVSALAQSHKPRSLYEGASIKFDQAQFIKPRENTNFSRACLLAPLIIQEIQDGKPGPVPSQVYFQSGSIELNGLPRQQMTYWWKPNNAAPNTNSPSGFFGVRLTMNTNGIPVIYEVLDDESHLRQIFVTQSLEEAAKTEFGSPFPGRRQVIERSLSESPQVVVSRVIDDPPEAMGPFLYFEASDSSFATLICRCMNAQFRKLRGQGLYELVPAARSGNTSDATALEAAIPRWLREDSSDQTNRLSRSLRLPTDF